MSRSRRHVRAFTLVELMFVISAASIALFVLGKLLIDGIYLQRIAGERANRLAVLESMVETLRADALVASGYTLTENENGPTLALRTYAEGSYRRVEWAFQGDHVLRRVDGREAGRFAAPRVCLAARLEHGARFDILALQTTVSPPPRSSRKSPRTYAERLLLPRCAASEPAP
jgi:type II secretory pathway pseudopilin PulG